MPHLFATSDLHVTHEGNGPILDSVVPETPEDWLLVAGDVAEKAEATISTLKTLRGRFAKVVWVPGNHELWTTNNDECQLRGQARYEYLVEQCREIDVLTPEDEFPVWRHGSRPLTIAPLFLLYDYSWRTPAAEGKSLEEALRQAREAGVVCTDEYFLHPDPYPSRQAWCEDRLKLSTERLDAIPEDHGTILMSHWPLHRHPTAPLYWPGVRDVVRHHEDRGLARPLPRGDRRLRPPAHPAHHRGRRRPLRRGLAGLSARVAEARAGRGAAAADHLAVMTRRAAAP